MIENKQRLIIVFQNRTMIFNEKNLVIISMKLLLAQYVEAVLGAAIQRYRHKGFHLKRADPLFVETI